MKGAPAAEPFYLTARATPSSGYSLGVESVAWVSSRLGVGATGSAAQIRCSAPSCAC